MSKLISKKDIFRIIAKSLKLLKIKLMKKLVQKTKKIGIHYLN